jgi:DinB superfamily
MENNQIAVQIVLEGFKSNLKRTTSLLNELSDKDLLQEIVIFKNTGHYVFGHLTAVHDSMIPLLGLGDSLYPELAEVFIKNPDKSDLQKPSIVELRIQWNEIQQALIAKLTSLTTAQWFEKHTAVSDEDFVKEPHGNRFNVVFTRANHLAYHVGQLVLLKN